MNSDPKVKDVLGLAPYGEALKIGVEKSLQTAQEFLYALCRPAAEETGLLLRDQVRLWRAKNLASIANKARELVSIGPEGVQLKAPPRIVHEVIEHGSWCEDEELQKMWAGLLASSCSPDGKDESNILISDILKRLSTAEAKLIEYSCTASKKVIPRGGLFSVLRMTEAIEHISEITGWLDHGIAQAHLGHLRSLGLFSHTSDTPAALQVVLSTWGYDITPSDLALHLYVRCSGSNKSPQEFFVATNSVGIWP